MLKRLSKLILVFVMIFSWIFGYPPVYENFWRARIFNFPPKIQEVQAAIALRGTPKIGSASNGGDVTLTFDTGANAPQTGDVVFLFGGRGNSSDAFGWGPNTTGYTPIATIDSTGPKFGVWYKVMEASPDLTVQGEGGGDSTQGVVYGAYIINGSTINSAIFDQTATSTGQLTSWVPNGPSIVTQTAGAWVITHAANSATDASRGTVTNYTLIPGSNVNETVDDFTSEAAYRLIASPTTADPPAWSSWTSGTGGAITIALKPAVSTLGPGTDPDSAEVAPESGIRDAGSFTFSTTASVDSITALTVVLSSGSGYDNLSEVRITSDNGATTYFSAISNPTSDTLNFSGGTPIPVTGSSVQFKIRVTPETHTNMPVPPGGNYTFSPYVSAFTSGGNTAGSDSNANTLTIDNTSPNGADPTGGSAGDAKVNLNWTTSNSGDFSRSVVLRWTSGSVGSEKPAEGTDYTIAQDIDTAAVACVRTTDGASTSVTDAVDGSGGGGCRTTALTNGLQYSYKIFQKDLRGNYDAGVAFTGSPFTPAAAGTLTVDIVDTDGNPVSSPTMAMGAKEFSFTYQTANGVFGVTDRKIRVNNTTANPQWTLSIAASNGLDALWSNAGETKKYDFNDPTANAEDGADSPDTVGGQMTINASGASLGGTCSATDITKGSDSFSEDVTDSIPLLTAGALADIGCYWDLTNVSVSQTIPASQDIDSYTLNLLLTVTPGP